MSDQITKNKADWKTIQHSMQMEGWEVDDKELQEIAAEYESDNCSSLPEAIITAATNSNRPLSEVAKEVLQGFRRKPK